MTTPAQSSIEAALERIRARVDDALNEWLPAENVEPAEVHRAMRYSLFSGGKRLRPAVVLLTAEACGSGLPPATPRRSGPEGPSHTEAALPAACALECVHTYSLIHDDLPAMDDDSLRRGRPTCHKAFGEATAILAGDALLTIAFEVLTRHSPPDLAAPLVLELASGAGTQGMVGGQVLDMRPYRRRQEAVSSGQKAEGGRQTGGRGRSKASASGGDAESGDPNPAKAAQLEAIHRWKTAALFRAAARMGAIAARADAARIEAAGVFGLNLGLAFQVADDILDVEGTAATLGKSPGKDRAAGKLTYPAVHGVEASRAAAAAFAASARQALAGVAPSAALLAGLADLVVTRRS